LHEKLTETQLHPTQSRVRRLACPEGICLLLNPTVHQVQQLLAVQEWLCYQANLMSSQHVWLLSPAIEASRIFLYD
jgi:hypothetical protein